CSATVRGSLTCEPPNELLWSIKYRLSVRLVVVSFADQFSPKDLPIAASTVAYAGKCPGPSPSRNPDPKPKLPETHVFAGNVAVKPVLRVCRWSWSRKKNPSGGGLKSVRPPVIPPEPSTDW